MSHRVLDEGKVGGGGGGWGGGGGGALYNGLPALSGRNESLKTVFRVSMNCGVVEMVPASPSPLARRMSYCIAECDSAGC